MPDPSAGRRVCGVVVTYHPDAEVVENVRAMVRECGEIVVVDNGSDEGSLAPLANVPGATLVRLESNLGIATALNRGAMWARERGFAWCIAFDQDSRPEPGMVDAMWATHLRLPEAAVIGPRIHEHGSDPSGYRWVVEHGRWPWLFRREACNGTDVPAVTMLVTSGSLFTLDVWEEVGGFNDRLFIDYVDVDFCLSVLRSGRTIPVSANAVLRHRLGERRIVQFMGRQFRPMGHAPFRHYYIARNRVFMWRRHAWAVPHWAAFDLSFAIYNALRVIAFEPEKWLKLKAMALGTWDGVGGRTGPCPPERTRVLQGPGATRESE